MTTEKQILANRANCLNSTGPRTEEGKRLASRNAVTHGLLADDILIKGENPNQYEIFRWHLMADLDPDGQLETLLAERIIGFFWRLARAARMEQGLLDLLSEAPEKTDKPSVLPFHVVIRKTYTDPTADPDYQEFLKRQQQGDLDHEPNLQPEPPAIAPADCPPPLPDDNPSAGRKLADVPGEDSQALGRIVRSDFAGGSRLERLLRYEGQIERSLYRALAELQRLQYIRKRNEAIWVEPEPKQEGMEMNTSAS